MTALRKRFKAQVNLAKQIGKLGEETWCSTMSHYNTTQGGGGGGGVVGAHTQYIEVQCTTCTLGLCAAIQHMELTR